MPVEPKAKRDVAAVAWLLCGGLLILTLSRAGDAPGFSQCGWPVERAAARGWTTDVACGGAEAQDVGALRGPARLLFGLALDLNRADARTLEVLPRIGPTRAAAIVRARSQARFTSPADLQRVSGIGPRTVEGLVGQVHAGDGR
ncbi:MAG: hypothetical protein GY944_14420 [bacterium]|nr:hypothetical protein [bacterium]MCP5042217.1 hypothetical protein [bacterium]